jgi:hypothetical protein
MALPLSLRFILVGSIIVALMSMQLGPYYSQKLLDVQDGDAIVVTGRYGTVRC